MIEYIKFYSARQRAFFHYRYSQYLHTKEQSDTFRVWRLIILLKCAKCVGPVRVNSQLLTSKEKAYHVRTMYMYIIYEMCTLYNEHCTQSTFILYTQFIYTMKYDIKV